MYVVKMILVEIIIGIVQRGIKESDGRDEFNYDILYIVRIFLNDKIYSHQVQQ
jgi:hypothetical protein